MSAKFRLGSKVWTIKGYGTVLSIWCDDESVFYTIEIDGGHGVYQFGESEVCEVKQDVM